MPPIPLSPTALTATRGALKGEILLQWNASAGATSYTIKRSLLDGQGFSTIATDVTNTSYVDSGLKTAKRYYYLVSAVNTSGESGYSNLATAIAR
jgi:cellulose 1,4-beta-cellobiosidase